MMEAAGMMPVANDHALQNYGNFTRACDNNPYARVLQLYRQDISLDNDEELSCPRRFKVLLR
jgi:hypothetical protein